MIKNFYQDQKNCYNHIKWIKNLIQIKKVYI